VNGGRNLHLEVDSLLLLAVNAPNSPFFDNFVGRLDSAGRAQAMFTVPDSPSFYGAPVYFGVVTLLPSWSGSWDMQSGSIDGVEFLSGTVSVEVDGPVRVFPGQDIIGQISFVQDEDRGLIEMTKGEKLKLKLVPVDPQFANDAIERLRIEFLDENDNVIKSFEKPTPAANGKMKKIKFKARQSGAYQLRVTGVDGGTGHYKMFSSHKVKKKARERTVKFKIGKRLFGKFKLLAVRGTALTLTVKPRGGAPIPAAIELQAPDGATLGLDGFFSMDGDNLMVTDVPLWATGKYKVRIPGPRRAKYKVLISPTPPFEPGPVTLE
jgi:hypothetical protein